MISHDPKDAAPADRNVPSPQANALGVDGPPALVFQGNSACGPLRLALAREVDAVADAPPTGAEQVLRLAQAEPLLCAVEAWMHGPWDPAPLASDAPADADAQSGYAAVVRDPALAPPGSRLRVPLDALRVPPPEALRTPALEWSAHDATVVLGDVPADALDQLEIGALLWLPGAFATAWDVRLTDPVGRLPPCAARLDLAAQRIVVSPGSASVAAPADGDALLQVVLSRPVRLPLDRWLGWGPAGAPYAWPTPQPWEAELRQGRTVLARGALLPVGEGCGLRIASLPLAEQAA